MDFAAYEYCRNVYDPMSLKEKRNWVYYCCSTITIANLSQLKKRAFLLLYLCFVLQQGFEIIFFPNIFPSFCTLAFVSHLNWHYFFFVVCSEYQSNNPHVWCPPFLLALKFYGLWCPLFICVSLRFLFSVFLPLLCRLLSILFAVQFGSVCFCWLLIWLHVLIFLVGMWGFLF